MLTGKAHAFAALTSLLKVCNHPHLLTWDEREGKRMDEQPEGMHYGDWQLSGKMHVLRQVRVMVLTLT